MTADLLAGLIGANLALAAAILAILALRVPIRRLAGARIAYALWLIAPLAALASFLPPLRLAPAMSLSVTLRPVAQAAAADLAGAFVQSAPHADPALAIVAVWLAGAAIALVVVVRRQRLTVALLGRLSREAGGLLRAANPAVGPAVIGLIVSRIVLPADFEQRFDPREQTLILAHERAHMAAWDVRINAAALVCACLNWFNPLVLLAARLIRQDQELACDAAVIARHPNTRRTYAQALLKTQGAPSPLPLGCYWPARSPQRLKERIVMLTQKTPGRARRLAATGVIATLGVGVSYAAWAANPQAAAPAIIQAVAVVAAPPAPAVLQTTGPVAAPVAPTRPAMLITVSTPGAAPAAPYGIDPTTAVNIQAGNFTTNPDNCTTHMGQRVNLAQNQTSIIADDMVSTAARVDGQCARQISRLDATGNVFYVAPDRTIRGDAATYDVAAGTVTFTGNVDVVEGKNVSIADQAIFNTRTNALDLSGHVRAVNGPNNLAPTKASDVQTSAPPSVSGRAPPAPPRALDFGNPPAGGVLILPNDTRPQADPQAPARPSVVTRPNWLSLPSADDLARAFPERAMRLNTEGKATLHRVVADDGALSNCTVASETPAGYAFGDAALSLAAKYRMNPQTASGASVGGAQVMVPVAFAIH